MKDAKSFEKLMRTVPVFHSGLVEEAWAVGREKALEVLERLMLETRDEDATGVFAAKVLGKLGGDDVVDLLLRLLVIAEKRRDAVIAERVLNGLIGVGEEIIEKARALAESSSSRELMAVVAQALVAVGAKGEWLYALVVRTLEWNPEAGATMLKELGDPLGVVAVRRMMDEFHAGQRRMDTVAFVLLATAFDELGGRLTDQDLAFFDGLNRPPKQKRVRRNELCPCGSGVKAKRCHHAGATEAVN